MPVRFALGQRFAGVDVRLAMWLVSIAVAFGLIFGQVAEARPLAAHHAGAKFTVVIAELTESRQDVTPGPACDPGIACATFVVPAGPFPLRADAIAGILRPYSRRSRRRFGGPTVSLPPPRNLR